MPNVITRHPFFLILIAFFFILVSCKQSHSLKTDEVLLVVNKNSSSGQQLANYYSKKRNIGSHRIFFVAMSEKEYCSREEYQEQLKKPLQSFLMTGNLERKIKCLLLFYGLPLKIKEGKSLRNIKLKTPIEKETAASVDSEIALVKIDNYPLGGWLTNPYYKINSKKKSSIKKGNTLMVCRLDAPSPDMVKRMINDSMDVEQKQLEGIAYFDARWALDSDGRLSAYQQYDRFIHDAGRIVGKSGKMPVVMNDTNDLFQEGMCKNAALYCGWYSLAQYINAFQWAKGAIGYHIASAECTTLKKEKSEVWCKRMIEEGVAATIGPVGEPYVQAFPVPVVFFGTLTDGYDTLVEAYFASLPHVSWKMVLIGDPLYRPFDIF